MTTHRNTIVIALFAAFWVSWLLPIGWEGGDLLLGFDGARFAWATFVSAVNWLVGAADDHGYSGWMGAFAFVYYVLMALPNVLVVASSVLLLKNARGSPWLLGPCVFAMLLWGTYFPKSFLYIGYTLWVLSGVGLLALAIRQYRAFATGAHRELLLGLGAYAAYAAILVLIAGRVAF